MKMLSVLSLSLQRAVFWLLLRSTPTARGSLLSRDDADGVPVAWVTPPESRENEVIFFLHGGGYCWGSIDSHRAFVSQIAAAVGCRALLVEYRRAPEDPFPAALDDALQAYRWLCAREPDSRIVIAGESAGAGLSASLMLCLKEEGELPVAGFLLSPWADLEGEATREWFSGGMAAMARKQLRKTAEQYAADTDLRDPRISPVYGNLTGLPPLLIHAGRNEVLVGDAHVLAERARQQGVDVTLELYEGRMHALHSLTRFSKRAREYLGKAARFLRESLL